MLYVERNIGTIKLNPKSPSPMWAFVAHMLLLGLRFNLQVCSNFAPRFLDAREIKRYSLTIICFCINFFMYRSKGHQLVANVCTDPIFSFLTNIEY